MPAPNKKLKTPSKQFQKNLTFLPKTIDEENRTVEAIISAGTKGLRRRWDGDYYEQLEITEKSVDLSRANNGAPILLDHVNWSVAERQIGVIEKAWVQNGEVRALLKFSKNENVTPIWNNIKDGILRHFSIGYQPLRIKEITEKNAKIRTFLTTKFQILEVSLVSIGFDDRAVTRGSEDTKYFEIDIESPTITRSAEMPPEDENQQEVVTQSETPQINQDLEAEKVRHLKAKADLAELDLAEKMKSGETPETRSEKEIIAETEKRVVEQIGYVREMGLKYNFKPEEEKKLIEDKADRSAVNEFILERGAAEHGENPTNCVSRGYTQKPIERGMDESETRHDAIVTAIRH